MIPKITLKKIAAEFNVSIATVSKALNDSHDISTNTKEKIKEFAKKHHYKPNKIALSLLNKKTKTNAGMLDIIINFYKKYGNGNMQ